MDERTPPAANPAHDENAGGISLWTAELIILTFRRICIIYLSEHPHEGDAPTMTLITETQLTAMRAALAALEAKPKTQFTNPEVVEALAREIRHAQDKLGYSLTDIALLLQKHGMSIQPTTLRGYLRRLKEAAPKPKARKTRTSTARTMPAAAGPAVVVDGTAPLSGETMADDDVVLEVVDGQGG